MSSIANEKLSSMKSVLVVVDVQNEFVEDPRLGSNSIIFLDAMTALLSACRNKHLPVFHVHYVTELDGRGYLAHHKAERRMRCLRGTAEADPHPTATPLSGEPVFAKHPYSAFSTVEFEKQLAEANAEELIICGLYSHACVRQTAMDALDRNFAVTIVADAIASYDPKHAELTKNFLSERGVNYASSKTLIHQLSKSQDNPPIPSISNDLIYPVACVSGKWIQRTTEKLAEQRNPSDWNQVLGYVPNAEKKLIDSAVSSAVDAQKKWVTKPLEERLAAVKAWGQILESNLEEFLPLMVIEVGKPVTACRAEFGLLTSSIQVILKTFRNEAFEHICKETENQVASARRCPRGVVAIIAPWNNPVFLPASKIAAAIALGNGVVWKPALPCARTSQALQNSLVAAGIPAGLVNLVFGGSTTAQQLISHPGINAVTLTGSVETGRQVAATCGSLLKPLQAELGGNNAAIVTKDCNLRDVARKIALSAFGYAGQACTATRRVIVLKAIETEFTDLLKNSVEELVIGQPDDPDTFIGPVISRSKQLQVNQLVKAAKNEAQIFEVEVTSDCSIDGCWLPLRIIQGLDESHPLVQNETFAPILVIQSATDMEDAIRLCNNVPNGLIASLFSDDESRQKLFLDSAEAGILQLNLPSRNLHMESPFGGWKDSGLGPPEHGQWDLDFHTQWQAVNKKRNLD
jgi:alpha-ketoglutaric semialdehyde dehydrogenase